MKNKIYRMTSLSALSLLMVFGVSACRRAKYQELQESMSAANTNEIMTLGEVPTETVGETLVFTPVTMPPTTQTTEPITETFESNEAGSSETDCPETTPETTTETIIQPVPNALIPDNSSFQLTAMHKDGNIGSYEGKTICQERNRGYI